VNPEELEFYNKSDPITINNLSKKFGKFYAVSDLTLSIKQNEIMTFLGHNGAGKTTAIYMLTGVLGPTEGNAWVYGSDIKQNMPSV
jgi:ABC-type multidrug transport system ATPase subunit